MAKRRGVIECTDTGGELLPRVSAASVQRVLDSPVNILEGKANNYALVWCSELGIGIVRNGREIQAAQFTLTSCNPSKSMTLVGAGGRDELIGRFLQVIKTRKSYAYPEDKK